MVEMGAQITWERRLDGAGGKDELRGMKPKPTWKSRDTFGPLRTVAGVADDGQVCRREMASNLVFSSCNEDKLKETKAIVALTNLKTGFAV